MSIYFCHSHSIQMTISYYTSSWQTIWHANLKLDSSCMIMWRLTKFAHNFAIFTVCEWPFLITHLHAKQFGTETLSFLQIVLSCEERQNVHTLFKPLTFVKSFSKEITVCILPNLLFFCHQIEEEEAICIWVVSNLNSTMENATNAHAIAQYLIQSPNCGVCTSTLAVGDIVNV